MAREQNAFQERRRDPMLNNRVVTYEEMCHLLGDQELTEIQLRERWNCLTKVDTTALGEFILIDEGDTINVPPALLEHTKLVGKYLEAIQGGVLDGGGSAFNAAWKAATAPSPSVESSMQMLRLECNRCFKGNLSSDVLFNIIRVLAPVLGRAESWAMFNQRLLENYDPALKRFKGCLAPVLVRTMIMFALPLWPPRPPIFLASKTLPTLPDQLWYKVSSYVLVCGGQWWNLAKHPLTWLVQNENKHVIGVRMLVPCRSQLATFIPESLQDSLQNSDVPLDRDWENASLQELQQLLWSGSETLSAFQNLKELRITSVTQAVGICFRVEARVPVLLIGNFEMEADISLANMVASRLQSEYSKVDAITVGVDTETTERQLQSAIRAGASTVLMRSSVVSLSSSKQLLHKVLIDRCYGEARIIASLHCGDPLRWSESDPLCWLELTQQLRNAAIFC